MGLPSPAVPWQAGDSGEDISSVDPEATPPIPLAPNLFLIGGCAGVVVGMMEFLYAVPRAAWQPAGSVFLVVGVTGSLLGFCGLAYGWFLQFLNGFSSSRLPFGVKLLLLAAAAAAAASRYKPHHAAVIGAAQLVVLGWVWWRASARGCAVVLASTVLLYVLSPLFNGHAMDRVFSERETSTILLAVVCMLPLLTSALLSVIAVKPSAARAPVVVKAAAAALTAVFLTVCSSVFLVRLWGFNTMGYLEATLLGLKIGCIVTLLTMVAGLRPVRLRVSRRELNLIAVLVLLSLFVASAYTGMRGDTASRLLLTQLPDTSFIANNIASLLDRDRDGFSSVFGFGDCDDTDPGINPGAIDWPGDGVDENCFGGDLKSTVHRYFNLPVDAEPPAAAATSRARRKIVVVVLLDTLRADAVDYSGAPDSLTPKIAKIAHQSVWFDHAYAQSNNTLDSLPYLLHMGFRDFTRYHRPWTLVSQFKTAGIASAAVFQSGPRLWFSEMDDVLMGFDSKLYPDDRVRYRTSHDTAALAVEQLSQHKGDAPLFVWVHFERLHDSFTQLMEGERMRTEGLNLSELVRLWDVQRMVALMKERYLAALGDVDNAMGVLWEGIQRAEADADVLLILTSDHGEEFYDHGGLFHMGTLHEELVRVPLIVYQTGGAPRLEPTPVGLYRVPGTVLRWLGFTGRYLDEMNLLADPLPPYEIFGYFAYAGEWQRRSLMVIEDGYKLIYDTGQGRLELYDLARDPQEHHNVAGEPRYQQTERHLVEKMDTTMFYMNYGDVEYARRLQDAGGRIRRRPMISAALAQPEALIRIGGQADSPH